jgi:hypothetical protein
MKTMSKYALILMLASLTASAGGWSQAVDVMIETELCVSYRAKVDGEYLVVEALPGKGWHVYAMDNELRAEEALKGQMSLGVDGPTRITLTGGLEPAGGWLQSEPHDYSKPDMRWYTWGYEDSAVFAVKVTGEGPTSLGVRGQACDATRCKNIDVTLELPAAKPGGPTSLAVDKLVAVRTN